MLERESVPRTLAFAGGVALICSLIVSLAVTWLRPIQLAQRSAGQNLAVLVAAGLASPGDDVDEREVVRRYLELEPRLVDLDAARYVAADASMIAAYDFRAAADDPAASREIAPESDLASIGRRPLLMPIHLSYGDGGLEQIVLPVYGRGMWSTIYGHIVLAGDLSTVAGIWFGEHGETPGIGDRIQNTDWLAEWTGKQAFDADGSLILRIGRSDGPAASRVDGISGATVTVEAVDRFVRYWLGSDGYGPFLAGLREEP